MGNRQAGSNHGRRALAAIGATVLLAGVVSAGSATAADSPSFTQTFAPAPGSDLPSKDALGTNAGLSPRLAELAGGLADKSKVAQADDLSLASHGAGSLERDGNRYIVTARADQVTSQLLDDLRAAGAEIVSNNADYGTVDLSVAADDLVAIARVPGVKSVSEALTPMVGSVDGPSIPGKRAGSQAKVNTCQGSVTSEGDTQMNAAAARQTFNVDGFGQKVGILSDSFDSGQKSTTRAAQDIASGDLPGPGNPCGHTDAVQVLAEGGPDNEDEGRGMAQIVHDIAPGADLAFSASGATGDDMANNVLALKNAGASVIVDDITYFDEPMFQEGSVSNAVDQVVAAGVPYYSSAANSNVIVNGQNVGSFETPALRPGGQCISGVTGGGAGSSCMDFGPSGSPDPSFDVLLNAGSTLQINLQWAQPRNGVTTDLDMFAVSGSTIVGQSVNNNIQSQVPFELLNLQNPTNTAQDVGIVVNRSSATPTGTPRFKFILGRPSLSNIQTPRPGDILGPTIFGHNGGANSVSTAAIPYDNASTPETYSSRGPVAYYFGPVSGTTPAAALATPQVLNKPDLAATDNVSTTFFLPTQTAGVFRFGGTSAAAPHAAAVAALQKSANPFLSVGDVVGAQEATAVPVGGFGHTDVGAGLINAVGAVGAHPTLVPETTITKEPKKHVFSRSVTYKFEADLPGSQFVCKIDRSKPVLCASPVRVKHIPYGKHTFLVGALFNNQLDASPAVDKFKRKRKIGR